jgi:DNA-binding transcriptional MerR regulator
VKLMTIGAFAERTRLSPKALRLYDRLGLLSPARTDPVSGYRFYGEDQVAGARLVALLRHLGMPLAVIADVAGKPPAEAAQAVAGYWAGVETVMADRRALVSYIQATLTGDDMPTYDIQTRTIPSAPCFPSAAICTRTRPLPSSATPSPGCGQPRPAWKASPAAPSWCSTARSATTATGR